jgi:hypothetical protein
MLGRTNLNKTAPATFASAYLWVSPIGIELCDWISPCNPQVAAMAFGGGGGGSHWHDSKEGGIIPGHNNDNMVNLSVGL